MHRVETGRISEGIEVLRKVLLTFILAIGGLGLWWSLEREPSTVESVSRHKASVEPVANSVAESVVVIPPRFTGHAIRPHPRPRPSVRAGLASAGHPALQSLARGSRRVGPEKSHLVLAAHAIPQKTYQGPADLVLTQVSGFVILASEPAAPESLNEAVMNINERPVVWNTNTRHAQIISGALIVRLHRMETSQALARRHGLSLLSTDESIKTVYYKMPDGFHVYSGLRRLRVDRDVEHVELELLSGGMRPR